ncbi:MAG: tyrosine recombinase XerD [Gemmatimonadota bacterium]
MKARGNVGDSWGTGLERERFEEYLAFGRGVEGAARARYLHAVDRFHEYVRRWRGGGGGFSRPNLRQYLAFLKKQGLAPATARGHFTGLRAYGDFLVEEGRTADNAAETVLLPRRAQRLPKVLSHYAVAELLRKGVENGDRPGGLRDIALLEFLYATGVRSAEARALRLRDLNLDEGWAVVHGKGLKDRLVFFHEQSAKALRSYLLSGRPQLLGLRSSDHVFLNARGAALSKMAVWTIVTEAGERAGLGRSVSPHVLRHTFATHMVEGGADLVSLARLLGHADLSTLEVYVHLSQTHLRRAMRRHPRNTSPATTPMS